MEGRGSRAGRASTRRRCFALAAALGLSLLAAAPAGAQSESPLLPEPPSSSAAPAPAQPAPAAPTTIRLSNERTWSRWAFVERAVRARREPNYNSRVVKRLKTYTEDGTDELVLALSQRELSDGSVWVRVRLPMRPNNTTGWVPRDALGRYRLVTTFLGVDRRRFRASLYRRGRRIWTARIGVGQRRWPTPPGRFYVRERLVPRNKNGIYGVFAFGTSAYSSVLTDWPGGGVIGIHGTNQPGLIPGRISHGCIRVRNARISRLRRLMPLGTPIHIK